MSENQNSQEFEANLAAQKSEASEELSEEALEGIAGGVTREFSRTVEVFGDDGKLDRRTTTERNYSGRKPRAKGKN